MALTNMQRQQLLPIIEQLTPEQRTAVRDSLIRLQQESPNAQIDFSDIENIASQIGQPSQEQPTPTPSPAEEAPGPLDHIEPGVTALPRMMMDPAGRKAMEGQWGSSVKRRAGEFTGAIKNTFYPTDEGGEFAPERWTPGVLAQLAKGATDLGDVAMGQPHTPQSQMVADMAGELKAETTEPERIAEDPTAPIVNLADILAMALPPLGTAMAGTRMVGRAGSILGKVGRATQKAGRAADIVGDLPRHATAGVAKTIPKAADMGRKALSAVTGVTTGQSQNVIDQTFQAGKKGGLSGRRALRSEMSEARTAKKTAEEGGRVGATLTPEEQAAAFANQAPVTKGTSAGVAEDVIRTMNETQQRYGEDLSGIPRYLDEMGETVDIGPIRDAVIDDLQRNSEVRIYRTRSAPGRALDVEVELPFNIQEQVKPNLERAIKKVAELPDRVPASEVVNLVKGLGEVETGAPTGDRIIGMMRKPLRQTLSDLPTPSGKTYDEAMQPFSDFQRGIEGFEEKIGAPAMDRGTKRASPTKLGSAMETAFGSGKEVPINAIRRAEELWPEVLGDLSTRIAAQRMQGYTPTGLAGHMKLVQTGAGVAGGIAAGMVGLETFLVTLPVIAAFYSPNLVARVMSNAGVSARAVDEVVGTLQQAREIAQRNNIPIDKYTTVGEILERTRGGLEEQGQAGPGSQLPRIGEGAQARELPTIGEGAQSRLLPLIGQSR